MTTTMMESANPPRMAFGFDENQRKYKCCCGSVRVRTGALIVATLKMFGVLMAVMDLFTTGGPSSYYSLSYPSPTDPNYDRPRSDPKHILTTTSTTTGDGDQEIDQSQKSIISIEKSPLSDNEHRTYSDQDGLGAVRTSSTVLYLLLEAVAVSCLIYAIRRDRPKFVIPEMAFISVCMSLEVIAALLLVVAAAFGSDTLLAIVVENMRERGRALSREEEYQIRHMLPTVLTLMAFALIAAAAVEFWFFNVLRAFYRYLRDKAAFQFNNAIMMQQQHQAMNNYGYQPIVITNTEMPFGAKDTPPGYNEVVMSKPADQQQQAGAAATVATPPDVNQPPPPAYTETAVQKGSDGK